MTRDAKMGTTHASPSSKTTPTKSDYPIESRGPDESCKPEIDDIALPSALSEGNVSKQLENLASLDDGAQLMLEFEGQLDDVTEKEYNRLRRKIDLHLLPLMATLYWVQFSDKVSLGSASILGLKTDNDLGTARYNNLSSFFYITYLAFEYPCNLILQRFKTGKVLTVATLLWAILLLCHLACHSYAGLMTLRLLLGALEGIVTPGFLLVTSSYYKMEEQATRVGLWFLMNGLATIFNALVAYGAQFITLGNWKPWRAFFLILGLFTFVVAILFLLFFPEMPAEAKFLTRRERAMALKRVAGNQSGSKNKHFKKDQLLEALKDPKIWLFGLYALLSNIPNSLTQQRSIIIAELGYDTLTTELLNVPTGVIEIITIPAATFLARRFDRAHVMAIFTLPSIIGPAMELAISDAHPIARLVGVYLAPINTAGFVLTLSWNAAAAAGTTKKITANAVMLVFYCVGNIVGAQIWVNKFSPHNTVPWAIVLVVYALCYPTGYALWWIMRSENKRRDANQATKRNDEGQQHEVSIKLGEDSGMHHLDTAFLDLTDKQNKNFRYPL